MLYKWTLLQTCLEKYFQLVLKGLLKVFVRGTIPYSISYQNFGEALCSLFFSGDLLMTSLKSQKLSVFMHCSVLVQILRSISQEKLLYVFQTFANTYRLTSMHGRFL